MATLYRAQLLLPGLPDDPYPRLDEVHARVVRLTGSLEGAWVVQLDRDGPMVRGHREDAAASWTIELFPGWAAGDEDAAHWALWVHTGPAVDIDRGGAVLGLGLGVGVSAVVWFGLYSLVPLGFQLALPIAILAFLASSFVLSVAIPILLNKGLDAARSRQIAASVASAAASSADFEMAR